jgi:hypothetical protein
MLLVLSHCKGVANLNSASIWFLLTLNSESDVRLRTLDCQSKHLVTHTLHFFTYHFYLILLVNGQHPGCGITATI